MNEPLPDEKIYEQLAQKLLPQIKAGKFTEEQKLQFIAESPTWAQGLAEYDELCEVWPLLRKMRKPKGAENN